MQNFEEDEKKEKVDKIFLTEITCSTKERRLILENFDKKRNKTKNKNKKTKGVDKYNSKQKSTAMCIPEKNSFKNYSSHSKLFWKKVLF